MNRFSNDSVYPWILFFIPLIFLFFIATPRPTAAQTIQSQTPIPGGTLNVDTTWTAANSPYTVQGTVTVANGVTLTIEPGVELYWNNSSHFLTLNSGATLAAEGTEADPILFGRNGTGHWGGIYIASGGQATLSHCEISYGGASTAYGGLYTASSLVSVSDCAIYDSNHYGLRLVGTGIAPSFTRVHIQDSGADAVLQSTFDMTPAYNELSMSGNGQNAIVSSGATVNRHITLIPPGLVGDQVIPYRLTGSSSVTIAAAQALTVTPGVEIRFNSASQFLSVQNGGRFHAVGVPENPIIFTGVTPSPGSWGGVYIYGGGEASLGHCEIGYGGASTAYGGLYTASSAVNVSDCRIHHSGHHGLRLVGAGLSPVFTNVQIENSGANAVLQSTFDMTPAYNELSLSGNGQNAIVSSGATVNRHIALIPPGLVGDQVIPYRLTGSSSVMIAPAQALTVTPGVEIRFNSASQFLSVQNGGRFHAVGVPENPIIFTGVTPSPGSWGGVYIYGGGEASLGHCEIGYGGASTAYGGLYTASSQVNVSDCRIHHSGHHGLNLSGAGLAPTFTRVQIENSGANAVLQSTFDMTPAYNELRLSGNGQNAIVAPGATVNRHITLRQAGVVGDQPIPYRLTGSTNVTVANGQALTITAGLELRFDSASQFLWVNNGGRLHAVGAAANPIVFTSALTETATAGSWSGVGVASGGQATLSHCEIGYGGASTAYGGLYTASSQVNVSDCRIHHSGHHGLNLSGAGLAPTFTRVLIENSGANAVLQSTFDMTPLYNGLTLRDNGQNAIVTPGGTVNRHITLRRPGTVDGGQVIPYRFTGSSSVTVANEQLLTIMPGVELYFNSTSQQLWVNSGGQLRAVGTAQRPILFSGVSAGAGSWGGIHIAAGGQAELDACRVEKGGASSAYGNISIASSAVSVTRCQIRLAGNDGIRVSANAQPHLRFLSIEANGFGLRNTTPATTVDASFNWWNHPTGPTHATNPGGMGQPVSNGVLFNPWFDSPAFNVTDLELVSVVAATAVDLGDDISVTYSGRNLSDAPLLRGWTDSLYVSPTPELGPDAQLLTRVHNENGLAALTQYTNTVTAPFSGVIPGDYYVIAVVDSRSIIPDLDRDNNIGATAETTAVTIPELTLGVALNNNINAGRDRYYRLTLPENDDILVILNLPTGWQGELYLRRGQIPTRSQFDAKPVSFGAAEQRIFLPNALEGEWYVLVHGRPEAGGGAPFSLLAESRPFLLFDAQGRVGGNAGSITLNVTGAGFTPGTAVTLRDNGNIIATAGVEWVNSYNLLATFDLTGAPLGIYDLWAVAGGDQDSLTDAFTIVEGVGPLLEADLVLPPVTRSNMPFRARVVFENVGDANLDLPMLRIQAPLGGLVWSDGVTRDNATDSLQFVAVPENYLSGGVLAPGQRGSFEFMGLIPAEGATNFVLTVVTIDHDAPFDAEALRQQIRPDDPPLLWDDAFDVVAVSLGQTYGSYVTALGGAADEARGYGRAFQSARALLSYLVERAIVLDLPADIRGRLYVAAGDDVVPLPRANINLILPFDLYDAEDGAAGDFTWYDGSFALRDLSLGTFDVLVARHRAPAPATVVFDGTPQQGLAITVAAGGAIQGIVREEDTWWGYIREAGVEVRAADGSLLASAVTDPFGRYLLTGLPLHEPVTLSAVSASFLPSGPVTVTIPASGLAYQILSMSIGGSISGIVYGPDNQPVEGALVRAVPLWGDSGQTILSGPGGLYRLDGLSNGTYLVTAATAVAAPATANNVTVVEGVLTPNIDLTMLAAGGLQLTVTDESSGAALPGAVALPELVGLFNHQAYADGSGLIALSGLPPGQVGVEVRAEGFLPRTVTATVSAGSVTPLAVALRPSGFIGGTVQRSGGGPLANMPVTLSNERLFALTTYTDSSGQFAFTAVPDGDYSLAIGEGEGEGSALLSGAMVDRQSVTLSAANNVVDLLWELDATVVSGQVFAADGVTPVSQARVDLLRDGQRVDTAVVNDDGQYRFLILAAGDYTLSAAQTAIGLAALDVTVTLGSDLPQQHLIIGGGTLTFNLTHNGAPVEAAVVILSRDDWSEDTVWLLESDAAGQATLPHWPAGAYTAVVAAPELAETQLTVIQGAGGQTINLSLAEGRTVSGQVTIENGLAPFAQLRFVNELTGQAVYTFADQHGLYELDRLADGDYTVWLFSGAGRFRATAVSGVAINGPGPHLIDFTVSAAGGASLSGYVTDSAGEPVINAVLVVRDANGYVVSEARSDIFGFYRFTRLPQGQLTLQSRAAGYTPQTRLVNMPPIGQVTVAVNIGAATALALSAEAAVIQGVPVSLSSTPFYQTVMTGGRLVRPERHPYHEAFEMPPDPPPVNPNRDCETNRFVALINLRQAERAADRAFDAWSDQYQEALWEFGTDFAVTAATYTKLTADAALIATGLAAIATGSAAATAPVALVASAGNYATELYFGLKYGKFNEAQVALRLLSDTLRTATQRVGGAITGIGGLYAQLDNVTRLMQSIDSQQASTIARINQAEELYLEQVQRLHQARRNFEAYDKSKDCKPYKDEKKEKDPPDEEDEEEVDEEEVTRNDSWDPNDIVGPQGYGPERWIRRDHTTLPYTIRFENEPDAAAPAREVFITHTLDASLDWTTFAFGDVGFGEYTLAVPPGRQTFFARLDLQSELGMYVDVTGDFDLTTGTASWYFAAIDPATFDLLADPIGGFLPPNLSSPEGEGFVNFTVRARNTAVTGATIIAQASIIFDANEAIETPEYINTLDAEPPTSGVNPLPTESPLNFTVSWSGSDGAGSGVAHYDVYVAVDGGPFVRWLHRTTATSALFNGEAGRSYAFYSVATDNVGWRQPTPTTAQASTTVSGDAPPIGHKLFLPVIIRP